MLMSARSLSNAKKSSTKEKERRVNFMEFKMMSYHKQDSYVYEIFILAAQRMNLS